MGGNETSSRIQGASRSLQLKDGKTIKATWLLFRFEICMKT